MSVPIRVGPEQHAEVLTGLDERRGCLPGTRIEPTVVGEKPGEPRAARACRWLAVEQRGEQSEGVDELAHGCARRRVGSRREQQLQPGDTALGEAGPRDAETRSPPPLSVGQRACEG